MSAPSRTGWLLVCAPAILLAIIMFGYFRPTTRLMALERTAAQMRSAPSRKAALQSIQEQAAERRKSLAELTKRREGYVARWDQLRKGFTPTSDRPESLTKLVAVLIKHDLHVVSKQPLAGNGNLSGPWQQIEQRLKQPIEQAFPEQGGAKPAAAAPAPIAALPTGDRRTIWEIELAGTYDQVEQALREMIAVDPALTPLSLEMEEPKPEIQLRRWKLILAF